MELDLVAKEHPLLDVVILKEFIIALLVSITVIIFLNSIALALSRKWVDEPVG